MKFKLTVLLTTLLLAACAPADVTGNSAPTPKEAQTIVVVTDEYSNGETDEVKVKAVGCVWGYYRDVTGEYLGDGKLYCYAEEEYSSVPGGWNHSYVRSSAVFSGKAIRWYVPTEGE